MCTIPHLLSIFSLGQRKKNFYLYFWSAILSHCIARASCSIVLSSFSGGHWAPEKENKDAQVNKTLLLFLLIFWFLRMYFDCSGQRCIATTTSIVRVSVASFTWIHFSMDLFSSYFQFSRLRFLFLILSLSLSLLFSFSRSLARSLPLLYYTR